jgi:peptide/nickel transport system permease protein
MIGYIVRRLLATVVTLWLLATIGFALVQLIPGDPARQLAGPTAPASVVEKIRHAYGFDRPLVDRYGLMLERFAHGDLGYSFSRSEAVRSVVARDVKQTLTLTVFAFVTEVAIGIPLALFVVSRKGRLADRSLLTAAGASSSVPGFLIGLLLLYFFAFKLGWFPLGGVGPVFSSYYVLPVLSVGVPFGLVMARLLRTKLLDEQQEDYVAFALSQGEPMWKVRWRHMLPNALLPLVSLLALDFATLFSSVAVVEVVFSIPGLGFDLFQGIREVDTPLIVGIALIAGLIVTLVNFLADMILIAADPRVRLAAAAGAT